MRKSLRSSKTLSRSIITPFRSIQNRHETALSQNMYESLCEDAVRRLQVEVDMLRRQFQLERELRTKDTVSIHQKVAILSKENIQRFDSLKDIFTQIESNIDQRLIQRQTKIQQIENNRIAVQSNIDFLFKKTWEIDTAMNEIINKETESGVTSFVNLQTMTFDMKQELQSIKQYLQRMDDVPFKSNDDSTNFRLQGLQEQLKDLAYRYEPLLKNRQTLEKIEDELASINHILKEQEQKVNGLAFQSQGKLQDIYMYVDEQWQKKIQTKLSRIVNSYNINFQELEDTNTEIKDILEEVINVNGNLSQKLLSVISNKLDTSLFKQTINSLSNQFTETLTLNYEKINEIRDKQYQVQHQLRCLKDILDKHDFQKNIGTRSVQKDIDESQSCKDLQQPFIVSPRHTNRKKLKLGNCRSKSNFQDLQVHTKQDI